MRSPQPHPILRPTYPQKRSIWRWYRSRHPVAQLGLGCFTLIVLLFAGLFCVIGTPAFIQGVQNGQATSTAESRATTQPTPSNQASNNPRMGGSLDDFVAQYGPPTKTAPDNETFVSNHVQITAYVTKAQSVNRVYVSGPSTWNINDTFTFCKQFLPNDAQEFNGIVTTTPAFVDYHSSLGEIVMQLQTPTCLLFISPS